MIKEININLSGIERNIRKGERYLAKGRSAKAVEPLTKARNLVMERCAFNRPLISRILLLRSKAFSGCGEMLLAKWDLEKAMRLNPEIAETAEFSYN